MNDAVTGTDPTVLLFLPGFPLVALELQFSSQDQSSPESNGSNGGANHIPASGVLPGPATFQGYASTPKMCLSYW